MSLRELALAVAYVVASACVVNGVRMWSEPAAWIVAGMCAAAGAWLFLVEVGEK